MLKVEEVEGFLAGKLMQELVRLKSFSTKASASDLAHAIAPEVMALLAGARADELEQLRAWYKQEERTAKEIRIHVKQRIDEVHIQQQAITNVAKTKEGQRPWKA